MKTAYSGGLKFAMTTVILTAFLLVGGDCSGGSVDPPFHAETLKIEKYHAMCRLAPEAIQSLSTRISQLGFRLNLSDYDEETGATLVAILSLHLDGVSLTDIQGEKDVKRVVQILRESQSDPNGGRISRNEAQVNVQWPHNKPVIELPLKWLDDIPVIRCLLNGKPANLYVDTACQPICLYEDRLARFSLSVAGQHVYPRYTAFGRVEKAHFAEPFVLAFNDGLSMQVSGTPCLPGSGRDPNHDVDGILGVRVLKALNGVLDFRTSQLVLSLEKSTRKAPSTASDEPDLK